MEDFDVAGFLGDVLGDAVWQDSWLLVIPAIGLGIALLLWTLNTAWYMIQGFLGR